MNTSSVHFDFDRVFAEPPVRAAGCVLAGGESRRMGTDKALLTLDGEPLIVRAVRCFSAFSEILISASDPERYAFAGVPVVPDEEAGLGPLGGFLSVLNAAKADFVCFRPVDAPLAPTELHRLLAYVMASENAENPAIKRAAVVPTMKGRPEPLFACLSKSASPVLETLVSSGQRRASAVFPLIDTVYLPLDAPEITARLGDPAAYLVNANDPDTFSKLRSPSLANHPR